LKALLGDAVKQKPEVCKHEQFERQTVIDPIPALLVCALPDGLLNAKAKVAALGLGGKSNVSDLRSLQKENPNNRVAITLLSRGLPPAIAIEYPGSDSS
jgi:hypothetical protein